MAQVQVKARAGQQFQQEIKAGPHSFVADAPKSVGGAEVGPEPHELLLASLGACTSITLQMYAKRKGWDLQDVQVDLKEEQLDDAESGKPISKITREIHVTGNLEPEQLEQLKTVADKCPIHKLLSGPKQINTQLDKTN